MKKVFARQIKAIDATIRQIEDEMKNNAPHHWTEENCPLCKVFKMPHVKRCGDCPLKLIKAPSVTFHFKTTGAHCAKLREYFSVGDSSTIYLSVFVDVLRCLKERLLKQLVY